MTLNCLNALCRDKYSKHIYLSSNNVIITRNGCLCISEGPHICSAVHPGKYHEDIDIPQNKMISKELVQI